MDISGILEAEDNLFNQNRAEEVEELLMGGISVALDEGDGGALLQLLNELIGYYRESSRFEDAYKVADEIKSVASRILPEMSVPYATSLLNIATAYRTGGRLDDAMAEYKKVEKIYEEVLEPDNRLWGSLFNNESLMYQETGEFAKAKELLLKALEVAVNTGNVYEEAVTRANIAGTCMQLGELDEGFEHAVKSAEIFKSLEVFDGHYAAALTAMGSYYYIKGEFEKGMEVYGAAMEAMEGALGKNAYYERIAENYETCRQALLEKRAKEASADLAKSGSAGGTENSGNAGNSGNADGLAVRGIDICRSYFNEVGFPMLEEKFPEYMDKMAIGLVGEGSDCYGFDDEISRDHDWGPEFCIWLTDEVYDKIGAELEKAYEKLPTEFHGIKRGAVVSGAGRRGVIKISDFCRKHLGVWSKSGIRDEIDWTSVSDASLSAFVNGEVWIDKEGIFSRLRSEVGSGYPEPVLYKKLAQSCAEFSQAGQYNYLRCLKRGDKVTAGIMLSDAIRSACKIAYYMENRFPPHDKWLYKGLDGLMGGSALKEGLNTLLMCEEKLIPGVIEKIGESLAMEMYVLDYISDTDPYLDHQTEELMMKSFYSANSNEELTKIIARCEFEEFDKVQNEGGRASCQNDWATFGIMRRSQYLTWNRTMLLQYLYDFKRESALGHNLITEKYGRMMESTAPERYEEIKDNFPALTDEQRAIIEEICKIQVGWMEEFSVKYPKLAAQARTVHTGDDKSYDTSYETYLRGEISTYSDKMLQLYTKFIVELAREGKNLAKMTMENSCRLYGYESLEKAEAFYEL
ncbi:MAG: DUF4125 family protein [Lachnospiraceae bacterium]|nr:DUF4125 family protein [Lachnospiraceae bacterium]